MKLVTWNVNGLRSVIEKSLPQFLAEYQPDILCLQETKVQPDQADLSCLDGYERHFNLAEQKGYSGTAILTKTAPQSVVAGIGAAEFDREGRVLAAEFEKFHLVTVYTPNSQRELLRLEYRLQWDAAFREFVRAKAASKPVLFCGDLNVAHQEADLANPRSNRRNAGFTDEERQSFTQTLQAGFVDVFRHLEPDAKGAYTWWTYRGTARQKNIGWRLDYWVCSPALLPSIRKCTLLPGVMGSDHCPVLLEMK